MNAAICLICGCSLDLSKKFKVINSHAVHEDCADIYDSRDLGSIDLPERISDWFGVEEDDRQLAEPMGDE